MTEKQKAQKFFDSLSDDQRWELGDDLVFYGAAQWADLGLEDKPTKEFIRHLDDIRINWEMSRG